MLLREDTEDIILKRVAYLVSKNTTLSKAFEIANKENEQRQLLSKRFKNRIGPTFEDSDLCEYV